MLKQQRDACEAMIEEKNKLIGDFEHVSCMETVLCNTLILKSVHNLQLN